MVVIAVIAFIWRINDPQVMHYLQGINVLYFILVLSLIPLVSIIGWFGATMTFPIEKE
jgi:hypothetical protein